MKKIRGVILLVIILAVTLFVINNIKLYDIKSAVLAKEDDIQIESITQLGGWGEWFQEYSLVVEKDGSKYRIWTDGDGEIDDWEVLN
ncbi:hypothetical protein [Jeotgalibacillus salarius]|uniref:DUF3139 domain-containing protein n=1 Tax=Jeotgalibacillus salarius TaxID=546023 RepID=A0A4Y8LHW9_9BACL|nr:hypothetical protein [Jeotgalibacillus salarius]TFE02334.1 hypothetical protein E2626_07080 [Jeotgalibacillus salarius]